MVLQVLLALLADAVFKSAASKERAAAADIAGYFERRALPQTRTARPVPTR